MAVLRPLTEDDVDAVSVFFRKIDTEAYRENFSPHEFTEEEARRVSAYRGRDLYVGVFTEGPSHQMIGYGMLRGLDEGYSTPSLGLCLMNEFQSRGYGGRLLQYLLDSCVERKASCVMLKVKRANATARKLYEANGFEFTPLDGDFLIGTLRLEAEIGGERG